LTENLRITCKIFLKNWFSPIMLIVKLKINVLSIRSTDLSWKLSVISLAMKDCHAA